VSLCCGRPLYDWGMLSRAKRLLQEILRALATEIEQQTPIVILEPSCAAVFRDEMLNLLPRDDRARSLSQQTFLLSEFLERKARHFTLPQIRAQALVHGHCHHKSILKMTDEEAVLRKIGLDFKTPAQGCCGMAGSFGFEEDKYATSIAVGELELLPAIRKAPPDCLIIANGFSCREQIAQCTDRHALHLAEVILLALHGAEQSTSYPERPRIDRMQREVRRSMARAASAAAGAVAAGAILWAFSRKYRL
jgi:Fe-S oxidoreductase